MAIFNSYVDITRGYLPVPLLIFPDLSLCDLLQAIGHGVADRKLLSMRPDNIYSLLSTIMANLRYSVPSKMVGFL